MSILLTALVLNMVLAIPGILLLWYLPSRRRWSHRRIVPYMAAYGAFLGATLSWLFGVKGWAMVFWTVFIAILAGVWMLLRAKEWDDLTFGDKTKDTFSE